MNYFKCKHYLFFSLMFLMTVVSCRMEQNLPNDDSDESQKIQKLKEYYQLGGSQIKILSYNTFLLRDITPISTTQWSQNKRAEKLGDANFINNYDVLLLQECFDNKACTSLRKKLSNKFPYLTPVLGQTKQGWNNTLGDWREFISGGFENGGVMVASKYLIEYMDQYIFSKGCDADGLALKGFVYVRILKNNKPIHIITTHLQSTQPGCREKEVQIRENQLKVIKSYVDNLKIPKDEILIYGGDFNIIRDTPEYSKMLELLNVSAPTYKGLPYTWDTKTNTMAAYHYPYPANNREYIDYIFVSNDHLLTPLWNNVVFDPVSPTFISYTNFAQDKYYWVDYSDHYPVEGNIYSDETTPKNSLKIRKYDRVSLKSVKTGKYITSNLLKINDWLKVSSTTPDENTWFNLVNTEGNYFDLKAGKIRVESSERINNFWYWELLNSGTYYYFPKFGKSLKNLELVLVKKKTGNTSSSIEDGDIVAFKDYTSAGNAYYLQVYKKDGTDWIYLNGKSTGTSEQFEIKFSF